jgi:hypothetical protein
VILQRVVWGRKFDSLVYWALIPIVFGVVLTTVAELSFNWTGFLTAMAACLTTSTSNIMAEALLQVRCFALLLGTLHLLRGSSGLSWLSHWRQGDLSWTPRET